MADAGWVQPKRALTHLMMPCRSELAREKPENSVGCQVSRAIVSALREQARSYSGAV
jgi:hypothetical protein